MPSERSHWSPEERPVVDVLIAFALSRMNLGDAVSKLRALASPAEPNRELVAVLKALHEALTRAWTMGTLPAHVISSELVQRTTRAIANADRLAERDAAVAAPERAQEETREP